MFERLSAVSVGLMSCVTALCAPFAAHAQFGDGFGGGGDTFISDQTIATEYIERQNVDERLQTLGSDLLGDSVDLNTGALSFEQVDVSLPGNSGLEVAIRRTRGSEFPFPHLDSASYQYVPHENRRISNGFSDWELSVPYVSYQVPGYRSDSFRNACTYQGFGGMFFQLPGDDASVDLPFYEDHDIANGMDMHIPGRGSQKVLDAPQNVSWPSGTVKVTRDYWALSCIPANDGASGFLATAPNGNTYRFDRFIVRSDTAIPVTVQRGNIYNGGTNTYGGAIPRVEHVFLATEVQDVHGNWVRYTYNAAGRATRIEANDGRIIDITRNTDGLITSVSANGRTWTYDYLVSSGNSHLSGVNLPDGRSWSFNMVSFGSGTSQYYDTTFPDENISITHPSGVTGTFTLRSTRHRHGWNPLGIGRTPSNFTATTLNLEYFKSKSLATKTLTIPGGETQTWTYTYSGGWANNNSANEALAAGKWTEVTDPAGIRSRQYFHLDEMLDGLVSRTDVFEGTTLIRRTSNTYQVEEPLADTWLRNVNKATQVRPRHTTQTTTTQDGDTYTSVSTFNTNQSAASYSFGSPVQVTTSSNTHSATRTRNVSYQHFLSEWIIGLPKTVQWNGTLFDEYFWNNQGQLTSRNRFGQTEQTVTYHTDGNVHTVTDALNRTWTITNWKRGVPQTVTRPDGTTLTQTVDNNGWQTSFTDALNQTTSYTYNPMGWLTGVDLPGTFFASTNITYSGLGSGVVSTATTGNMRTVVTYDGLHRPTLVREDDLTGSAASRYVSTEYDVMGRQVFTSFPSHSAASTAGTETTYDAFGRAIQTRETVAPYATTTTAYLSGNIVEVTDAENNVSRTTYRAFGAPDNDEVMQVIDPIGTVTSFTRDIYGNITQLTQSGGLTSVTRNFYYDNRLRLCRHRAPEFGDELFAYDAADRLIQSSRGESASNSCGTPSAALRTVNTYDAMGRITHVNFPAGTPDITTTYDANGNALTVNRDGGVNWTYQYNELDQITREVLTLDGRTFTTSHGYNTNGHRSTFIPVEGNRVLSFDPNGFGEPRTLRTNNWRFADQIQYHANGLLSSATYKNGASLTQSINSRQLPTSLTVSHNIMDYDYTYDALRRVTAIDDVLVPTRNRSFGYDAAGRLSSATGEWGTGSFTYDRLNNIRERRLGNRVVTINYDTQNRVQNVTDSAGSGTRGWSYDARGNVIDNGPVSLTYDFTNQPTQAVVNGQTSSYLYDGNMRRVRTVENGVTTYWVYSNVTGNLIVRYRPAQNETFWYASAGGITLRYRAETGGYGVTYVDWQGSPVVATSGLSQSVVWRQRYTPFGEMLNDPAANRNNQGYTGHVQDDATGLTYMQARFYDPVAARFLSTDPIGYQDQLNLYAYVANDPINATDPTGMWQQAQQQRQEIENPAPGGDIRNDAQGDGHFGAARGARNHNGLDIEITAGDDVLAPIDGEVRVITAIYANDNPDFDGVEITNTNDDQSVKIFYVDPSVVTGDQVTQGDVIGTAQDVGGHYGGGMVNHVHVELRQNGIVVDPEQEIDLGNGP